VKFEVETPLRRRTIEVQRSADGWTVTVDGRAASVNLTRTGDRWSLLVGHASYEIAIEPRGRGRHYVHVDGDVVPVTLSVPGKRRSGAGGGDAYATGPVSIVSPMPGRVVKMLVTPGEAVVARQGLVVVEAMKMENELRAPRAGTITEIKVREGASVEANVVLVVMA
jgi:biotin carboxyl carrier protein